MLKEQFDIFLGKNLHLGSELTKSVSSACASSRCGKVQVRSERVSKDFKSILLYLLVSTRAVIGQFRACRTFLYGPLKFKVDSVAKLFCDLSPTVLNFYSK